MMDAFPLICHKNGGDTFAFQDGRKITVDQFLQDVSQLAALLPEQQYLLNLCTDRYRFIVGFSAALVRKQINLLPPNHTVSLIEKLSQQYTGMYCLTDTANEHLSLKIVSFPQFSGTNATKHLVPSFPSSQLAAIVFTSGSTGESLPYRKTWGGLVWSARAAAEILGVMSLPELSILGTVPPQHMYGLESTALIAMQGGLAMHAGKPFFPADIFTQLDALPRPRMLVTTPVHLRTLMTEYAALPPVEIVLCATAPLVPQLAIEAEKQFGAPLYEIYGCTESGQVATRRTAQTLEWRTFQGVMLRQDERGTWVSGGHVETETLLNDLIDLHSPQTFLLQGRTADLINIAGKRTSLANLNHHLNSIEGVQDGVFVMPDDKDGDVTRLMAFVVAPDMTSEALMQALRQRIDAAFLPRPLRFVDVLPRNQTGKLPREALQKLLSELEI
ncbi:AMP-binding protein [Sulfurirhabdus autotrophica]|uniref:Long-chain-fatty-acid--CoA ligase n=1 Tax=Sulfurirhabdus autotrophica TaxID=1706046 RepID=A0A4R3YAQ7_9PROT|nr:AMP-binding protein [Sulfurirhabdus autotrophica]TCV87473.1 acyl-coenzyme A synthetase/AMP-(fatty) acid ligase [Sulfurirhabdus autotrophica]